MNVHVYKLGRYSLDRKKQIFSRQILDVALITCDLTSHTQLPAASFRQLNECRQGQLTSSSTKKKNKQRR